MHGTVLSVNTGSAQPLLIQGRRILSGIGKQPVVGAVPVRALGLEGDEQADPSVHGGLSKAVYAFPVEHLAPWAAERTARGLPPPAGQVDTASLPHGFMGENLSLSGLLETDAWVGDELHFPDCVLRITEPRQPCYKFNAIMGFNQAGRHMALTGQCGFYLAVVKPGSIAAGQAFELRPGFRALSIAQAFAGKRAKHLRVD